MSDSKKGYSLACISFSVRRFLSLRLSPPPVLLVLKENLVDLEVMAWAFLLFDFGCFPRSLRLVLGFIGGDCYCGGALPFVCCYVSSIMLTVLLVLKKRFKNSLSRCAQLSMESGSSSVYHLNAFPLSERTNYLTMWSPFDPAVLHVSMKCVICCLGFPIPSNYWNFGG
ncbi:hypothetical protein LIER_22383 [Lithospermum erythrorhizon]|uniref:Transmembrane protein n=1 Tax=Lithospermum erythrorhizon TaxID=34254 RepID=A0AAV3QTN1_LITER